MPDDLTSGISILFTPGQVIEIRAITDDGIASGYFDSYEELVKKVSALDDVQSVQGIYATLNEVNSSLLSRRSNRIKMRLGKKDATTADADIIRRRWLPIDIDPVRISGVSSTDEEHQVAIDRAGIIGCFLTEWGFPEPIVADSGNGAHLLYRIDLPNDPASLELVKQCLETLSVLFSDDLANIDTANHNAARIWKLYGTVSRKGDNTKTRPHRRSRVILEPPCIEVVSKEQLERLAGALPVAPAAPAAARPKAGSQPDTRFNLPTWLGDHGIGVANQKDIKGGILYNLDECPFSSAHKDGAYAIEFHDGGLFAACKHASCGGGDQRWKELRDRYEPTAEHTTSSKPRPPPGGPPPTPSFSTMEGIGEATAVLQHGDPKGGMLKAFALDHEGDETAAECLILSIASRSVVNTTGLHVSVTGESGKGKSHTFTTMLKQVPERFRISGAMSNKALFYMEGLQPGMAIVLDDTSLSEDMSEILKGVTTSFRKPFLYRTVNKDRKGQVCVIPERCIWWVAKVEGSGDDQVFNRMLTCWIDDSPEQDNRVLARVLDQSQALPQTNIERPQVLVCRAMWELIGAERFHVVIPFAKKIKFQATDNRRNPEMLLDLIKSNAVIRFQQRERIDIEGIPCIMATRDDFDDAVKLYGLLNGTTGGQATKLTKKESDLVATIEKEKWPEFTISMLQKATGLSNGSIHRLMHGYAARGSTYTGLLEKCPAISFVDRTVIGEEEFSRISMARRANAYTFDPVLFHAWSSGGGVWIEDDVSSGNGNDFNPSTGVPSPSTMLKDLTGEPERPDYNLEGGSSLVGVEALSQSFNSVEGLGNDNSAVDLQTASTYTHLDVRDHVSFNKFDLMGPHIDAKDHTHHCVSDIGNVEVINQKSIQNHPMAEPDASVAGITLQHILQHIEGPNSKSNQETPMAEPVPQRSGLGLQQMLKDKTPLLKDNTGISFQDFKPIGSLETHTTCAACGRRGTNYIEKVTPARNSRKDKLAVRICKKCFEIAARKEQTKGPPLPGIIVLSRMVRISKDIGRCSVCDTGKAVYLDREAGTRLCQQCYDREARAVGPVKGGAGG